MIPKKIHYCWLGGAEKPKMVQKCIASWKKYCPDYEIIEWNESNLNLEQNDFARQAYEHQAWAFASDYFRLWIVAQHGGIYLDTDVEIIRSFNPLLELQGFAGFETETYVATGLGFGAEKGNAVVASLLQRFDDLPFVREDGTLDKTPCPWGETMVLQKQYNLQKDTGKVQTLNGFTIFPQIYFCPMNHDTGKITKTADTFSIHRFYGSWVDRDSEVTLRQAYYRNLFTQMCHIPHRVLQKCIGHDAYQNVKAKLKSFIRK